MRAEKMALARTGRPGLAEDDRARLKNADAGAAISTPTHRPTIETTEKARGYAPAGPRASPRPIAENAIVEEIWTIR